MGENSKIEWTHHTFNPWWGCVKVSPGCQHCYAETFSKRTGHQVWGVNAERRTFGDKHWKEPLKWDAEAKESGERRRVFCASMADVFEGREDLSPHRWRLFNLIEATPNLDWLLLTKRPENMLKLLPTNWLIDPRPNVWLGTTVENQEQAGKRIPELLTVPAVVRFLSCEPLLGPIDLKWDKPMRVGIDWVIVGGESGGGARPMHPNWARELRDQCVLAEVPFLFKQWGDFAPGNVTNATELVSPFGRTVLGGIDSGSAYMRRVGKKAAGRLLDGREWNEYPELGLAVKQ